MGALARVQNKFTHEMDWMGMGGKKPSDETSILLVKECFTQQDDRFVEELRKIRDAALLAGFVDQWKTDKRPWAREKMIEYLAAPLDCPGHNVVVKRLFKHAEKTQDDSLMAIFLTIFDCLVRRKRVKRFRWDGQSLSAGRYVEYETLATPRNSLTPSSVYEYTSWDGQKQLLIHSRPGHLLFTHRTRYYLRRRAWRYFRRMGFQRPGDYVKTISQSLICYQDEHLATGENLLDSWGLMQACFHHHDALAFGSTKISVASGRNLSDLSPAPRFPKLWKSETAFESLFSIVLNAGSRLVRVWASDLLRQEHQQRLAKLSGEQFLELLDHDDPEIQQFGAGLLETAEGLESMPLETWLKLTEAKNLTALETICKVMLERVSGDRLSLAQCIHLARAAATPAARLGLEFLKRRAIEMPDERRTLTDLADARCSATGKELGAWALGILGEQDVYDRDQVLCFFDSVSESIRDAAWEWLQPETVGWNDPGLWSRLLETPYDEVRLRLIEALEQRSRLPGTDVGDLAPLWCSVLLNVHRGGRGKPTALRQIVQAILHSPEQADALLPVVAAAARSIRAPEFRAGLAAAVALVEARPELKEAFSKHLPELTLEGVE
ncbi:MAG: hypothetical protein N2C14_33060 [Planctomycetales bacterium]